MPTPKALEAAPKPTKNSKQGREIAGILLGQTPNTGLVFFGVYGCATISIVQAVAVWGVSLNRSSIR